MKKKKISGLMTLVFILIILSVIGIGAVTLKDFFMTPSEQLQAAIGALEDGRIRKAERYFLMANESEDKDAVITSAYYLGQMYLAEGQKFKDNIQKAAPSYKKAALFLEKAAAAGIVDAQYQLALMYDTGDKIPENRAKAMAWMNEAAKQGYPDALYGLGVWVERGYMGDDIPMDKVILLYENAAAKGNVNAMTSLVAIYSGGFKEVPANPEKAAFWMENLKNATQKNADVQKKS